MSLRASYCIRPHTLNKWLYDNLDFDDLVSLRAVKQPIDEIAAIQDFFNKDVFKPIGASHSGSWNMAFNTQEFNSDYITPGDHIITLDDKVFVYHDKHGWFYSDSITLNDIVNHSLGRNISGDSAGVDDSIEVHPASVHSSTVGVVDDIAKVEFIKSVNEDGHFDAIGSYAFNTNEYNTDYSVTAGVNGISFEEEFELIVH